MTTIEGVNLNRRKVAIFGDSILKPILLVEGKRYSVSKAVDWAQIENKLDITIDNRSRMGATIRHGLSYLSEYLKNNRCDFALIEFGGNDCDYDWETVASDGETIHLPKTNPDEFMQTLNKMLDLCVENGVTPVLMSLPPINAERYYSFIVSRGLDETNILKHLYGDVQCIYRHQELYNDFVTETALRRNISYIDVRKNFLLSKNFFDLLCEDGIHPNAQGQQLIVNTIIDRFSNSVVG